jgi:hypothetical protein
MGHNAGRQRRADSERDRKREAERMEAPRREAARNLIGLWNLHLASGWQSMFYPTVRAAMLAGTPWLHVICSACRTEGECDLRKIDIHPNASVATIVRAMSCRGCHPHAPFAKPVGLTRRSWQGREPWKRRKHSFVDYAVNEPMGWGEAQSMRAQANSNGEPK